MDSGQNERPSKINKPSSFKENPVQKTEEFVSPEKIEAARQAWESLNRGRILNDPDERMAQKLAIESGIVPMGGAAEPIPLERISRIELLRIGREINNEAVRLRADEFPHGYLENQRGRIQALIDREVFTEDDEVRQAHDLINTLNQRIDEASEAEREAIKATRGEREERIGFYLQEDDRDQLKRDPIVWLDKQFDQLYLIAQQGQELSSPLVDQIQRLISDALQYVSKKRPDMTEKFATLNTLRFNLISMRTSIGYRSIENIKKASYSLGVHGLLSGFALEDGKVGAMFNRVHEYFEDQRLKSHLQHATPEMAHKLQQEIIQEQLELANKHLNNFTDLSFIPTELFNRTLEKIRANEKLDPDHGLDYLPDEEEVKGRIIEARSEITRSVRTAFDIFVSSQRQAVLVARGKHLTANDAYFADPFTGPLNVYNLEDLLIMKFGIYTAQDEEFVRRIKLDMADSNLRKKGLKPKSLSISEREDLGRRLFRDLFAVPDFFSSGWRIEGILKSIEERVGPEKAQDFALFMRLKLAKHPQREAIWGKIKTYRPEEILRLFRERSNDEINELFSEDAFRNAGIDSYDQFKAKYGSILSLLRADGFRSDNPEQINMANLNDGQKEKINTALGAGEGEKVAAMFRGMQSFIQNKGLVGILLNDNRFEDIYTRTLVIDDALLHRIEKEEDGFVPISKKYGIDQGGDSYVRSWTDTENAVLAGQHLLKFIKTEDPEGRIKEAMEFAEATSQYNGQEARANCIRYTIGTFLNLSKKDYFWEIIGLDKLPLRMSMSEIERIYGPQAKPISRDELRLQLDKIRLVLTANAEEETEEEKLKPEGERAKLRKKRKSKAERAFKDLEGLFEITKLDIAKTRGLQLLFYFILAAAGEGVKLAENSFELKRAA